MKSKFKKFIFIFVIAFMLPTYVLADAGLLVGRNYGNGNIDTSVDITNAQIQFALNGIGYISSTNPTYAWITGNQNGIKRLENQILFFSGHGNQNYMIFYDQNHTYNYSFKITGTASYSDIPTIKLTSYNMSKVKLAVFAGCETGIGSTNIASQTKNAGVKATLGWKVSISVASHTSWLQRFWSKIFNTGLGNMNTALQYANSFTYDDPGVKNISTYGQWSSAYSALSTNNNTLYNSNKNMNNLNVDNRKHNLNINTYGKTEESKLSLLEKYIISNINPFFKLSNCQTKKTAGQNYNIYDITYVLSGDIKTKLGYTIFEENNNFVALYDNTKNIDYKSINSINNDGDNQKYNNLNVNINEIINSQDAIIKNKETYKYYDDETQKIYYVIRLYLIDNNGVSYVKIYKYEI